MDEVAEIDMKRFQIFVNKGKVFYENQEMAPTAHSQTSNETGPSTAAFDLLFYTSLSINICVLCYFLLFYIANHIVLCCCKLSTGGRLGKLKAAHRNPTYRNFMHNIYFDSFLYTAIMIASTVLILDSHAMNAPFEINRSYLLHILYSCITGAYMFIFFKEFITAKSGPTKLMNLIVYGVSMTILATVVVTKEDVVLVAILAISNGDMLNINAARLMKNVFCLKGTMSYRVAIFMGTYATVVFRALLPIGLIILALVNGKPFNMSYPSVFFFFVGLLFFGALNTWQVNAALARICRKDGQIIEVQTREVQALPKPEDRVIQERIELPPSYADVCGEVDVERSLPVADVVANNEDSDSAFGSAEMISNAETFSQEKTSAFPGSAEMISNAETFSQEKTSAFGSAEMISNPETFDQEKNSSDVFVDIDLGLYSKSSEV